MFIYIIIYKKIVNFFNIKIKKVRNKYNTKVKKLSKLLF